MLLVPRLTLPADAASLADAVTVAVRDGMTAGELVPDQTYSVYQLADLLGVSRSPVREALLRLAEAGLVEIARNRGFRVVLPRARDVEEIFEVRLALEVPAAHRAAEVATDADRARLRSLLDRMAAAAAAGHETAYFDADRALHRALLEIAGNRRATRVVDDLRATTALLGPRTTATGRTLTGIHAEHEPVVAAVLAGDPGAAARAMGDHLTRTGALVARGLDARPGLTNPRPRA